MSSTPATRKILLAVTGLSPQIATETLYALWKEKESTQRPDAFIPTELHLITTQTGAGLAIEGLLEKGHFQALLNDYPQLGPIRFDASHIHLIRDAQGQPLSDIQTREENIQAADSIASLLQRFTSEENTQLHVSLAGGRKTMSFYTGYAFSMYAREQDQLSHVLVTSPFEHQPDFFFPPATPRPITLLTGEQTSSDQARVLLTPIPTVRLRSGQPQKLLDGSASFSETVSAIQKSLSPPNLLIDLRKKSVTCAGKPVSLSPRSLAWLTWWAKRLKTGQPQQNWRSLDGEENLRKDYLAIYKRLALSGDYEIAEQRFENTEQDPFHYKKIYEQYNSELKAELEQQLPYAAIHYLLKPTGKRPHTKHSLTLPSDAVTIID